MWLLVASAAVAVEKEGCSNVRSSAATHVQVLAIADEQACAAELPVGRVAAGAVSLADTLCLNVALAAAGAVLLATQLLLAAEVAGDACRKVQQQQHACCVRDSIVI